MQMLIKFESKSSRVKGVAFHPKRPWILASLHNGTVQLWDYRMGILLEKFKEHDGPVRGIAFHPSRDLFVSGGDDYKIRVWSYKTRRCLFTLQGHLDYVRTVYFHPVQPWIISASDDQTVRIWNWQSKQCIAVLAGHNHYVMCAQFHPTEDLVVSASLDQTVRVWDISGLRKKNAAGAPTMAMPEMIGAKAVGMSSGQPDLFGSMDVVVKFVLEGHMRGVNWCAFHPEKPLILSAGDDRQIKVWRMNDNKAWELDACRGHYNNVSSALFFPRRDFIISDSEDRSIRVWDASKRTLLQTFRREQDRFWCLCAHPEINLFAAGHDNGLIVFKLERERPASTMYQNSLVYVAGSELRVHDFNGNTTSTLLKIRGPSPGKYTPPPRSLSFNPAEKMILLSSDADGGSYELHQLSADLSGGQVRRGSGSSAVWIGRNRFAVLEKESQTIHIRDPANVTTKSFKAPIPTNHIFMAPGGNLILSSASSVVLFDVNSNAVISELSSPNVKYVSWSVDMTKVALLNKHAITIASNTLKQIAQVSETIRIKSAVWDEQNVLLYTTLNHLKYALTQGDKGVICTLDEPVYLTRVRGSTVYFIDRDAEACSIAIDPTEYRFKLALIQRNYEQVISTIRDSNLVGQSIIAYLQKKGYPEIALHFVRDKVTRFSLALDCGDMNTALETAKAIDKPQYWLKLSQEALRLGDIQTVEYAYQRLKDMNKLTFLYSITGATDELQKLSKNLSVTKNAAARFQTSLYTGDPEERVRIFRESGQLPLAYLTAKSHGLTEEADAILAAAEMSEADITGVSIVSVALKPSQPVAHVGDRNWPRIDVAKNSLDKKLFGPAGDSAAATRAYHQEDSAVLADTGYKLDHQGTRAKEANGGADRLTQDDFLDEEAEEGWGMEAELEIGDDEAMPEAASSEMALGELATPEADPDDLTILGRRAVSPLDFVMVGDFESAMRGFKAQHGIVNFKPLKPLFLEIYSSSRSVLSALPGVPPSRIPLFRPNDTGKSSSGLTVPTAACRFETHERELQDGLTLITEAKFESANAKLRRALQGLLFVVASDPVDADGVQKAIRTAREYVVGSAMGLMRRDLQASSPEESLGRQVELAAYFTHCAMQPEHIQLTLRSAMLGAYKAKCFRAAGEFARRLLQLSPPEKIAHQATQIQTRCDRQSRNAIDIDYDYHTPFVVCVGSLTPIYQGSPSLACPYCGAFYKPEFEDTLCRVCELAQIGA